MEGQRTTKRGAAPYKLLAVDMDGTLLDSRGAIPDGAAREIRRIAGAGVLFVVTTGRPIQGVEKYSPPLCLDGPVVTYNGAMVVDAASHGILFERGLLRSDAGRIVGLGLRRGATMCIWSRGRLYGNRLDARMREYEKLSGVEPLPVEDWEALLDRGVSKILWTDDPERIRKAREEIPPDLFQEVTCCTSQPCFLEFFNRRASKARALEFIGRLHGIRREEMVAIGDGPNDLDMIRFAGMGVAMGNACDEVKRAARYTTTSNDADGVANAIRYLWGEGRREAGPENPEIPENPGGERRGAGGRG